MKLLVDWIERTVGVRVRRLSALSGGDIHRAHRVELEDDRTLFVKWNDRVPKSGSQNPRSATSATGERSKRGGPKPGKNDRLTPAGPPETGFEICSAGMFAEEARGLDWLRETGAVAVPEVVHWVDAATSASGAVTFSALLLEYLEPCEVSGGDWETFGRSLAALHASTAAAFGALPNNFIGMLPQDNTPTESWTSFWIERRLEPQFKAAVDSGRGPARWNQVLPRLYDTVRAVVLEPERPERIHGDLWSGNCLMGTPRGPALVDPAAYAGHGEVDLAMMRLFGGFDERVMNAYFEVRGETSGLGERLELYQLYPLLVHANLFGGSYVASVDSLVRRFT